MEPDPERGCVCPAAAVPGRLEGHRFAPRAVDGSPNGSRRGGPLEGSHVRRQGAVEQTGEFAPEISGAILRLSEIRVN